MGIDAVDVEVAVVLPAHVVRRIGGLNRAESRDERVLERLRVGAAGRLHRSCPDDLHQMVDDDVPQGSDGVVEVPAILDAEVLRHRDLDGLDVVPVPDRLEQRVREPEIQDLLRPHLPEVVVDPVQLGLVEVLVKLVRERAGRLEVVAEGLLHDDPRILRQAGVGQPLDDPAEQEGRDLEVEDRCLGALDRLADTGVGRRVAEVPLDVGEPGGETVEHGRVELLTGADDRLARPLHQLLHRPVVHRDADDRAAEEPAPLQPVERPERHHLREVAGDPEDREDIGGSRCVSTLPRVRHRAPFLGPCSKRGRACRGTYQLRSEMLVKHRETIYQHGPATHVFGSRGATGRRLCSRIRTPLRCRSQAFTPNAPR